jgi:hypothetical protein
MKQIIEKFYADLLISIGGKIDEMIGSLIISNKSIAVLESWDEILDYLDSNIDEILNALEKENAEGEASDYIKLSALYLIYAFMYRLDERNS